MAENSATNADAPFADPYHHASPEAEAAERTRLAVIAAAKHAASPEGLAEAALAAARAEAAADAEELRWLRTARDAWQARDRALAAPLPPA